MGVGLDFRLHPGDPCGRQQWANESEFQNQISLLNGVLAKWVESLCSLGRVVRMSTVCLTLIWGHSGMLSHGLSHWNIKYVILKNLLHLLLVVVRPVVTRYRVTRKLVGTAGFGPSSRLSDHNPSYPNLLVINMFIVDCEVSFIFRTRKLELSKATWLTRGHPGSQHQSWVFTPWSSFLVSHKTRRISLTCGMWQVLDTQPQNMGHIFAV